MHGCWRQRSGSAETSVARLVKISASLLGTYWNATSIASVLTSVDTAPKFTSLGRSSDTIWLHCGSGMSNVSDSHHLVKREGVWYFRRRVPQHLIAALGKKVIQFSLRTSNKSEAKKRREIEDLKWSAHFSELEGRATG